MYTENDHAPITTRSTITFATTDHDSKQHRNFLSFYASHQLLGIIFVNVIFLNTPDLQEAYKNADIIQHGGREIEGFVNRAAVHIVAKDIQSLLHAYTYTTW